MMVLLLAGAIAAAIFACWCLLVVAVWGGR